jgi:hypothetical protein
MEPDSAVDMFNNAPNDNVKFTSYIGDDDSTTEAHIRQNVSYSVEKLSDVVHTKRSPPGVITYGKDLYGDDLKAALQQIFNEYSTNIVAEKLCPL